MAIETRRDPSNIDGAVAWGDEGPMNELRPQLAEVVFPKRDESAVLAKRLGDKVKDVTVVLANGSASKRLVTVYRPHRNDRTGNGSA